MTQHLGLGAQSFAWLFMPIVGGMLIGSLLSHRLAGAAGPWRSAAIGYGVMLAANSINVALAWWHAPGIPWSLLALPVYAMGLMLAQPGVQLLALDCAPTLRGTASSCFVATQQMGNALSAALLIPSLMGSTLSLAAGMASLQVFAALMLLLAYRFR